MTRCLACLIAILIALGPLAAQEGPATDLQSQLDRRVKGYRLSSENFIGALVQVARDFQIPMGIEWVDMPPPERLITLTWKDTTAREVLRSILSRQPGYEISIRRGVAHIRPASLILKDQDFLNLQIDRFEVRQMHVEMADRKLREIVRTRVSPPNQMSRTGIAGSLGMNPDEPTITFRLSGVTVRDVLDEIARASTKKIWIVTFCNDRALMPTGFRRTLTLWNSSPIPDAEQPNWDMLRWNDELPPRLRR